MAVEIDETQLAGLTGVSKTVQSMLGNPKARRLLLQAQKLINPDVAIPELDAAEPIMSEVAALRKELEDDRKARAEDATKRDDDARKADLSSSWERGRADLRAQGYTLEAIEKIEKEVMEKEGIANHKVAAAYFDKLNPAPEPVAPISNRFEPFAPPANEDAVKMQKMLFESPDQFLNTMIPQSLRDARSGGR